MSDCCEWCANGDRPDWPPETDKGMCLDCKYRWFKDTVVALVAEVEGHNCYKGQGVLCTCSGSERGYSRLLEVCGVKMVLAQREGRPFSPAAGYTMRVEMPSRKVVLG